MTHDLKPDNGASQQARPVHVPAMNPRHSDSYPPVDEAFAVAPKLVDHHPPKRRDMGPTTTARHEGSFLPSPERIDTPASVSLPVLGPPTARVGVGLQDVSRPVEQGEHGYTVNDYEFVRMYVKLAKARRDMGRIYSRDMGRIYSRDKLRFMQSVKRSLQREIKKTSARRVASSAAGSADVSPPPQA
ncbi:hypothetical protein CcaCcLH18_12855 [Colletotrichum camelliae]|nr:hypothetical protein CcaCcLH18_12855 [Colletotrichum camelliae]